MSSIKYGAPLYGQDKIIRTVTGSFSIAAATIEDIDPAEDLETIAHSFGEAHFPKLIFSIDGGTTYHDGGVGFRDPNDSAFRVIAYSYMDSSNVYIDAQNWDGSGYTVTYEIAIVEKGSYD